MACGPHRTILLKVGYVLDGMTGVDSEGRERDRGGGGGRTRSCCQWLGAAWWTMCSSTASKIAWTQDGNGDMSSTETSCLCPLALTMTVPPPANHQLVTWASSCSGTEIASSSSVRAGYFAREMGLSSEWIGPPPGVVCLKKKYRHCSHLSDHRYVRSMIAAADTLA